jgi:hypothetical protein
VGVYFLLISVLRVLLLERDVLVSERVKEENLPFCLRLPLAHLALLYMKFDTMTNNSC